MTGSFPFELVAVIVAAWIFLYFRDRVVPDWLDSLIAWFGMMIVLLSLLGITLWVMLRVRG